MQQPEGKKVLIGFRKILIGLVSILCLMIAPLYMQLEVYRVFASHLLILLSVVIGGNLLPKYIQQKKSP
jgi:hypothetical protein